MVAGEQQSDAEVPRGSQPIFPSMHGARRQQPRGAHPSARLTSPPPPDRHPAGHPSWNGGDCSTGKTDRARGAYPALCDLSLPALRGSQCTVSPERWRDGACASGASRAQFRRCFIFTSLSKDFKYTPNSVLNMVYFPVSRAGSHFPGRKAAPLSV